MLSELYDIGFDDYLNNESITFIEWGSCFPLYCPEKDIEIRIEFDNNNKRVFSFVSYE
jgi:tRNA threonylcarbamoyladenosine biosynthesis protein TsaE